MMDTKFLEKNFFSRHRNFSVAELFHRKNSINFFLEKCFQARATSSRLFDKEI